MRRLPADVEWAALDIVGIRLRFAEANAEHETPREARAWRLWRTAAG